MRSPEPLFCWKAIKRQSRENHEKAHALNVTTDRAIAVRRTPPEGRRARKYSLTFRRCGQAKTEMRRRIRPCARRDGRVRPIFATKARRRAGGRAAKRAARPSPLPRCRLISHSSSTPLVSRTRRRTSSPSSSMSAAVAPPRLIRKLQCIVETCASPTTRPRQPAASISCQAFWPGGFLNVEPPVFSRIGCEASRAAVIRSISATIVVALAGPALQHGAREDHVLRRARYDDRKNPSAALANVRTAPARSTPRASISDILGLAAVGAGVHAQRAADRAGNAAQECKAVDPGLRRGARDPHVGRRGAGDRRDDRRVVSIAPNALPPSRITTPAHAAVAHDEIGAEADDGDGDFGGQRGRANRRGRPRRRAKQNLAPGRRRETR